MYTNKVAVLTKMAAKATATWVLIVGNLNFIMWGQKYDRLLTNIFEKGEFSILQPHQLGNFLNGHQAYDNEE